MRSAAVIEDCMTAYLALKSRIGTKNCWMYWMNATTVPSSTSARACSRPPSQSMSAIDTVLTASTTEKSEASSLFERWFALRWAELSASNSSNIRGSRAERAIAAMPVIASWRNPLMRPIRSRMRR